MKWSVILLLITCSLQAVSVEMDLKYISMENGNFHLSGHSNLEKKTTTPPPGDWKLPKLVSDAPVYGLVPLGDREYLLVLDKKKKRDKFYNICYFDLNGDGDLTDEKQLKVEHSGTSGSQYFYTYFKPVDMEILVDGAKKSFRFALNISCHKNAEKKDVFAEENWVNFRIGLRSHYGYRGEMKVEGKSYYFDIADTNCNGRFDDFASDLKTYDYDNKRHVSGDSVFLYPKDEQVDYYDACMLSQFLNLAGTAYDVAVDCKTSKLSLAPTQHSLNALTLSGEVERLLLYDEENERSLMLYQPGLSTQVPVGTYKLILYQMERVTKEKDRWQLIASGTKNSPVLTIDDTQPAKLSLGEPFVPQVTVPEWARRNFSGSSKKSVQLSFIVVGSGEEVLSNVRRTEGNSTAIAMSGKSRDLPKEPTYKILAPDGEVVTQGSFEYG